MGITNQRETTLVWDRKTGRPLHNAIVWLDTRTAALCERLTRQLGSQVRGSGLICDQELPVAAADALVRLEPSRCN